MKPISGIVLTCVILALISCGNPAKPEKTGPAAAPPEDKTPAAVHAVGPVDFLRLSAVLLSPPAPTAVTDLSAEAVVVPPVPAEIDFQYQWIVNDKLVEEAAASTLACANFKKKQWVYCQVKAMAGEKESDWLQSKHVLIANSPPRLAASPAGNFTVPGQFTFQISASDPDQDPLAFELLSPLDQGIVLDPRTGVLTWKIDAETVDRLGKKIEIKFAVSDNNDGKTSGTITLDLTEPK